MKQAEQPDHQRQVRIKHVFGAAYDVVPGKQSSGEIDRKNRLEQKQSRRDPRKNQRTLKPQSDSDQDVSQIAEEEKILRTVLPPINRRPYHEPHGPRDLQPQRQPHGPLLYATHRDCYSGPCPPGEVRNFTH